MNPLDTPNVPVQFEARNISARAASSKDGPKYKVGFEVNKEVFDQFITANLDGACFAVKAARIDYDAPADDPFLSSNLEETEETEKRIPTGIRCREAIGLCNEADFKIFVSGTPFVDTPKKYLAHFCGGMESRRELDEGPDADKKYAAFCKIKNEYRKWQEEK